MRLSTLIIFACVVLLVNARSGMGFQAEDPKPQTAATLSPKAEKVKRQVRKIGTGARITVELTSSREYHGTIKWIDEESFQIDEVDLKQVITVNYNDTKKVYAGYGGKGIGGKRVNPKKGIIAIAILAGVLATILIVGKVGY